jgi:hypothetical protein
MNNKIIINIYLFIVVLTLPLDWFYPTASILREFGAKPACIILTAGGIYGIFANYVTLNIKQKKYEKKIITPLLIILILGGFSFLINIIFSWSSFDYTRNPLVQYLLQSLMFLTAIIAIVGNAKLSYFYNFPTRIILIIPYAVGIHLIVFLLQYNNYINCESELFSQFHSYTCGDDIRPTGLFSEPAYYGTFAALYGCALIFIKGKTKAILLNLFLAIFLFISAISINAKTTVVVMGIAVLGDLFHTSTSKNIKIVLSVIFIFSLCIASYFIIQLSALDVENNLSSAMRFGSSQLALNAGIEGYAIPGIGIGQFHFFYRPEFAPAYLLNSLEALDQFNINVETRASTYNLFIRIFIEIGIMGFILFVYFLYNIYKINIDKKFNYIVVLYCGSLGFLLTQDSYFYPPLIFSISLLIGIKYTNLDYK